MARWRTTEHIWILKINFLFFIFFQSNTSKLEGFGSKWYKLGQVGSKNWKCLCPIMGVYITFYVLGKLIFQVKWILWFDQNFTLYQTLEDKETIFSKMLYTTPNEGLVGMPLVVKVAKCKHVYGSLTSQMRVIMG